MINNIFKTTPKVPVQKQEPVPVYETTGNRYKTGLLVVDVQMMHNPREDLVSAIELEARKHDVVIRTQWLNQKDSLHQMVLKYAPADTSLLLRLEGAQIWTKLGYGLSAEQMKQLVALNCSDWFICGLETDASVLACAFNLWDMGIRPNVIKSLCGGARHSAGLNVLERQFGV